MADLDRATVAVTVVVSTLDRPALLGRCLNGLLACTRRPSEVVVVDQGTAPAAAVVRRAREDGLPVVHITQPRRGLSFSQNTGVAAATNDVVAVVDDDCVPDVRWLEVIDTAFRSTGRPLLLTGRVLPMPAEGDRVAAVSSRVSTRRAEWRSVPMPWELGTGGNFAVDRAAFLAVGGNDERLGTGSPGRGGNDLDLFHRIVVSGVLARYEPDLVVHHERSTVAEHRSRRGTYGFGVGAMLGLLLRRGDRHAPAVLLGWLRLRGRMALERRSRGGVGQEVRVMVGTVAGVAYGLRVGGAGRRPAGA